MIKHRGIMIKRIVAATTLLCFLVTQQVTPSALAEILTPATIREIPFAPNFRIELPADLGRVETLFQGQGKAILHIQEAHGDPEGQRKIEGILHLLKNKFGVDLVLVEGAVSKLHPELTRFFPGKPALERQILETLTEKSLITAPELFLSKEGKVEVFGIEDREAYIENTQVFVRVLKQKEKSVKFLKDFDLQMERVASGYLSKELRAFLKQEEWFETKVISLEARLRELRKQARRDLGLDLEDPREQLEWPMLVRFATLQKFESSLNSEALATESEKFLAAIHGPLSKVFGYDDRSVSLYEDIKTLLAGQTIRFQSTEDGTELLVEKMAAHLPRDFDYKAYPNVNRRFGMLLLQDEIKADSLMREMENLTKRLEEKLTASPREREAVALLRSYRLLQKLFALELTPGEYEEIVLGNVGAGFPRPETSKGEGTSPLRLKTFDLRPSALIERALALNRDKRVRDLNFAGDRRIDELFDLALEFYAWAKRRDSRMLENIEKRLRETGKTKAVVITGGFHARPFEDYFKNQGYFYARLTPKMTTFSGRDAYVQSIVENFFYPKDLRVSTLKDLPMIATPSDELLSLGRQPGRFAARVRAEIRLASPKISGTDLDRAAYFQQNRKTNDEKRATGFSRSELRNRSWYSLSPREMLLRTAMKDQTTAIGKLRPKVFISVPPFARIRKLGKTPPPTISDEEAMKLAEQWSEKKFGTETPPDDLGNSRSELRVDAGSAAPAAVPSYPARGELRLPPFASGTAGQSRPFAEPSQQRVEQSRLRSLMEGVRWSLFGVSLVALFDDMFGPGYALSMLSPWIVGLLLPGRVEAAAALLKARLKSSPSQTRDSIKAAIVRKALLVMLPITLLVSANIVWENRILDQTRKLYVFSDKVDGPEEVKAMKQFYSSWESRFPEGIQYRGDERSFSEITTKEAAKIAPKIKLTNHRKAIPKAFIHWVKSGSFFSWKRQFETFSVILVPIILMSIFISRPTSEKFLTDHVRRVRTLFIGAAFLGIYGSILQMADYLRLHGVFDWMNAFSPGDIFIQMGQGVMAYALGVLVLAPVQFLWAKFWDKKADSETPSQREVATEIEKPSDSPDTRSELRSNDNLSERFGLFTTYMTAAVTYENSVEVRIRLLREAAEFLAQWNAHRESLVNDQEWRIAARSLGVEGAETLVEEVLTIGKPIRLYIARHGELVETAQDLYQRLEGALGMPLEELREAAPQYVAAVEAVLRHEQEGAAMMGEIRRKWNLLVEARNKNMDRSELRVDAGSADTAAGLYRSVKSELRRGTEIVPRAAVPSYPARGELRSGGNFSLSKLAAGVVAAVVLVQAPDRVLGAEGAGHLDIPQIPSAQNHYQMQILNNPAIGSFSIYSADRLTPTNFIFSDRVPAGGVTGTTSWQDTNSPFADSRFYQVKGYTYADITNPIFTNAAIAETYVDLQTGLQRMVTPNGLPYNQQIGTNAPNMEITWMKSSDLGFKLMAEVNALILQSSAPVPGLTPETIQSNILNQLQQLDAIQTTYGLRDFSGRNTGVIPEVMLYRSGNMIPENNNGILYSTFDMMILTERLMTVREIFKGGIVRGIQNQAIAVSAETILKRINFSYFVDGSDRLSQLAVRRNGQVTFFNTYVDNKNTEARGFLPLIHEGMLGEPSQPLAVRVARGVRVWDHMGMTYQYYRAGSNMVSVARGDAANSAYTALYGNERYDFSKVAPESFGKSAFNYWSAAHYLASKLGDKVVGTAPGTGVAVNSYSQNGLDQPQTLVPAGPAMEVTLGGASQIENFVDMQTLAKKTGGYFPGWGLVDALDPKTGAPYPNNLKFIGQDQALILEAITFASGREMAARMPWYSFVAEKLKSVTPAPANVPITRDLAAGIQTHSLYTSINSYSGNSEQLQNGVMTLTYRVDSANTFSGFLGTGSWQIPSSTTLNLRLGDSAAWPATFKIAFKNNGTQLWSAQIDQPQSFQTREFSVPAIGTFNQVTVSVNISNVGSNLSGQIKILDLVTWPKPSATPAAAPRSELRRSQLRGTASSTPEAGRLMDSYQVPAQARRPSGVGRVGLRSELRTVEMTPEEVTDARAVDFYRMKQEVLGLFTLLKVARTGLAKEQDRYLLPGTSAIEAFTNQIDGLLRGIQVYADQLKDYLGEIRGASPEEKALLAQLQGAPAGLPLSPEELRKRSRDLAKQIENFTPLFTRAHDQSDQGTLTRLNLEVVPLLKLRLKVQMLLLQNELKNAQPKRRGAVMLTFASVIDIYRRLAYEFMWRERRARGEKAISRFRMGDASGRLVFNLFYETEPVLRVERDRGGEIILKQMVWKYVSVDGGPPALKPVLTDMHFDTMPDVYRSRIHALESQEEDYSQLIYYDLAMEDILKILVTYLDQPEMMPGKIKNQVVHSLKSMLEGPGGRRGLAKREALVTDEKRKPLPMPGPELLTAITTLEAGKIDHTIELIKSARRYIPARLKDIERRKKGTERKRNYIYLLIRDDAVRAALEKAEQVLGRKPVQAGELTELIRGFQEIEATYFRFILEEKNYKELKTAVATMILALSSLQNDALHDPESRRVEGNLTGIRIKIRAVQAALDRMAAEREDTAAVPPARQIFGGSHSARGEARSLMGVLNAMGPQALRQRFLESYQTGKIQKISKRADWLASQKFPSENKKLSAGVLVLRKIDGEWKFLVGQAINAAHPQNTVYTVPVGGVDQESDPRYESPDGFQSLEALGIVDQNDMVSDKRESVVAAAIRELKEETEIGPITMNQLVGRLDDVLEEDHGRLKLHHYFVYVDDSSNPEVAGSDEFQNPKWIPVKTLLESSEGQEIDAVESLVGGIPLRAVLRGGGILNLKKLMTKVLSPVRSELRYKIVNGEDEKEPSPEAVDTVQEMIDLAMATETELRAKFPKMYGALQRVNPRIVKALIVADFHEPKDTVNHLAKLYINGVLRLQDTLVLVTAFAKHFDKEIATPVYRGPDSIEGLGLSAAVNGILIKKNLFFVSRLILKTPDELSVLGLKPFMVTRLQQVLNAKGLQLARSELRSTPAERTILDQQGQIVLDFVAQPEIYRIQGEKIANELLNEGQVKNLLEGKFDSVIAMGSDDARVPLEATPIVMRLRRSNPALKTMTVGKWGTVHAGGSGEYWGQDTEGNKVRLPEAVYFKEVMDRLYKESGGLTELVDWVEPESDNSGTNAKYSKRLLAEKMKDPNLNFRPRRVLILKTPTQLRRGTATFIQQSESEETTVQRLGIEEIVSLPAYRVEIAKLKEAEAIDVLKICLRELGHFEEYTALGYMIPVPLSSEVTEAMKALKKLSFFRSELRSSDGPHALAKNRTGSGPVSALKRMQLPLGRVALGTARVSASWLRSELQLAMPVERVLVTEHQRNRVVPSLVHEKFGTEIYRTAIGAVAGDLEAVGQKTEVRLGAGLSEFIKTLPNFDRLLQPGTARGSSSRILDVREALPPVEDLAPVLLYLARHGEQKYSLAVVATSKELTDFYTALKKFSVQKLGFDPTLILKNQWTFLAVTRREHLQDIVSGQMKEKQDPTAVIGDSQLIPKIASAGNLVRIIARDTASRTSTVLVVAEKIDELLVNRLAFYEDKDLLATDLAAELGQEIQNLKRFLSAA